MKTITEQQLRLKIKRLILFFILSLIIIGIATFPLETELSVLIESVKNKDGWIGEWLTKVYMAIKETNMHYPFMSYGTDWLAFAHIVIAVVFWGPLKDPVKNKWVIQFGMMACILVFPFAFVCGTIRHIPFYWQLIDCSFGIVGLIPLYICYDNVLKLEKIINNK